MNLQIERLNSTGTCLSMFINGIKVYYSYNTPVAFLKDGVIIGTDKKYSVTTSKQMTKYIGVDKKIPHDLFVKELKLIGVN